VARYSVKHTGLYLNLTPWNEDLLQTILY